MTLDEFLQYINYYEGNQSLRESFNETYSSGSSEIILDETNRLFRLRNTSSALVFEASCLKSFRILEDTQPLFESQEIGLRCYESDAPARMRQLAGVIGEFNARRKEYEFRKEMERKREENAKRRGEEYQKQYIPMPSLGCEEPIKNFYVELVLEHPYWSDFSVEICGPRFQYNHPSVEGYICDYRNEAERMHELATNLMQFISPGAKEIHDGDLQSAAPVTRQTPAAGMNAIEEIKQYKELLDAGIITEEEFSIKKRQLLGL